MVVAVILMLVAVMVHDDDGAVIFTSILFILTLFTNKYSFW